MKTSLKRGGPLLVAAMALMLVVVPDVSAQLVSTNWVREDGKILVKFTGGSGTWTIPEWVGSVEILVLGGGGAGARGGAFGPPGGSPGGGAGGLYYSTNYSVTARSSITVTVGAGASNTTVNGDGAPGAPSVFGQIIAYGGGGGDYDTNAGGNQGGYSINGGSSITPGYLGGTGTGATGGGGAGENGRNGGYSPAYGGSGVSNNVTGTLLGYGGGGSAGYDGRNEGHGQFYGGGEGSEPESTPGTSGVNGLGGGGGGGRAANAGGGGSGVIYVVFDPMPPGMMFMIE